MMQQDLKQKIEEYIKQMPCLHVSAGKAMEISGNIKVNASDLNRLISLDPVLTGRILHLLNSSFDGLGPHVTSLVRSVTMLGLNTVKNLVFSSAVLEALPENRSVKGINMEDFWRHCVCVGVTAKMLAARQGLDPLFHDEYYIAGLLHDIGKVPLNAVFSANYALAVMTADRGQKSLTAAEENCLGINHCATGAMAAAAWKIEAPVADVIAHHHNACGYSGENTNILYTVSIADYFSGFFDMGFAGNRETEKPDQKIWERSGIAQNAHEELKEAVCGEIKKAHKFLSLEPF